jgi:hypothetical protein
MISEARHASIVSDWSYRRYEDVELEHGSDMSSLPSTLKGDKVREPSAFSTNVPCCHCITADGHDGVVAESPLAIPSNVCKSQRTI